MTDPSRPDVDVIVAVRDEARLVDGKIRDVLALRYPTARLRLIVADGTSTDDTPARLARAAARDPRIEWIDAGPGGKAAQLNAALARSQAPWVLVTDADARMPADTLIRLVDAARRDARVAVVGTPLVPRGAHPLDEWHWRLSNRIRRIEHRLGTTGLVVAPCYLFRRSLLDRFPLDAIADDVHVASLAAAAGRRVALVDVPVEEVRAPATGGAWLRVKLRRAQGYLHEVVRFLPRAGGMRGATGTVFFWRAIALTALPALAAVLALTAAAAAPSAAVGASSSA
ncbi:MAG: glycosyltransferase [Vicinamibacterales bacterium]